MAHLTDAQVTKLRHLADKDVTMEDLMERFGITQFTVSRIVRGSLYPEVGGPVQEANWVPKKKNKPVRRKKPVPVEEQKLRDLTELPAHETLRLLQALSHEWPRIREAFLILDQIMGSK